MTTHTSTRAGTGLVAAAVLALAVTACTGGAAPTGASSPAATPVPASAAPSPTAAPSKVIIRVDPTTVPTTDGTVPPEIVAAAAADVATRAGVAPADVTVVSADAVTWPNGAAGCPQMGFMYTDVVTPGYRVVLEAAGTTYDYRGSRRSGTVTWCENARPMG